MPPIEGALTYPSLYSTNVAGAAEHDAAAVRAGQYAAAAFDDSTTSLPAPAPPPLPPLTAGASAASAPPPPSLPASADARVAPKGADMRAAVAAGAWAA